MQHGEFFEHRRQWGVEPISPLDGSLLGSTASVPLPAALDKLSVEQVDALQERLYTESGIEVPLMRWNGRVLLRVSCQVYNEPAEYERLVEAISGVIDAMARE